MRLLVHNKAAIVHLVVLVEPPGREVVAQIGAVMILAASRHDTDVRAAQIVMKRMRQSERFVLLHFPICMIPTDLVRDVPGEYPVLSALNFLLQELATVRNGWSFHVSDIGTERQDQGGER